LSPPTLRPPSRNTPSPASKKQQSADRLARERTAFSFLYLLDAVLFASPAQGDGKFSNVAVGDAPRMYRGRNSKAALTSAVPVTVRARCPSLWIVAVYVAPSAPTIGPPAGKDPPPHNIDPPAYGGGFVIAPVIVVLPELIVNGIDSVSVLEK
jgi:hypothetical protein